MDTLRNISLKVILLLLTLATAVAQEREEIDTLEHFDTIGEYMDDRCEQFEKLTDIDCKDLPADPGTSGFWSSCDNSDCEMKIRVGNVVGDKIPIRIEVLSYVTGDPSEIRVSAKLKPTDEGYRDLLSVKETEGWAISSVTLDPNLEYTSDSEIYIRFTSGTERSDVDILDQITFVYSEPSSTVQLPMDDELDIEPPPIGWITTDCSYGYGTDDFPAECQMNVPGAAGTGFWSSCAKSSCTLRNTGRLTRTFEELPTSVTINSYVSGNAQIDVWALDGLRPINVGIIRNTQWTDTTFSLIGLGLQLDSQLIFQPKSTAYPDNVDLIDKITVRYSDLSTTTTTPESTPESTIESTPESTIESTPASTIDSTPESTTESTPESTIESTPASTIDSTPESTTESTPESTIESTPESTFKSTPESTESTPEATESTPGSTESTPGSTEATPGSTFQSTPVSTESTPGSTESTPESTESTPESATESTPESTSESSTESTPESTTTPESATESTPESTSETTLESTPESTPESTAETTPESTTESTPVSTTESAPGSSNEPPTTAGPTTNTGPTSTTTRAPPPNEDFWEGGDPSGGWGTDCEYHDYIENFPPVCPLNVNPGQRTGFMSSCGSECIMKYTGRVSLTAFEDLPTTVIVNSYVSGDAYIEVSVMVAGESKHVGTIRNTSWADKTYSLLGLGLDTESEILFMPRSTDYPDHVDIIEKITVRFSDPPTATTPRITTTPSVVPPVTEKSEGENLLIILILVAVGVLFIILLASLGYHCCQSQRKHRHRRFSADSDDSFDESQRQQRHNPRFQRVNHSTSKQPNLPPPNNPNSSGGSRFPRSPNPTRYPRNTSQYQDPRFPNRNNDHPRSEIKSSRQVRLQ